eukprot:CAMPEP_0194279810 /NCGR_PEP_ID=MMETSP0169-20130528/14138_1 /TAXON_ID=218684 /ORGANISM="Corethron pennatum, Strain L29A3" /LENGTH=383 /DNA_ID=CAMNT_0039024279 /DNA_START=49 /DNA_END=1197 /DNA_ORIENTATION=+
MKFPCSMKVITACLSLTRIIYAEEISLMFENPEYSCPEGWACTGSAMVVSSIFSMGGTFRRGTGTSDTFTLPKGTTNVTFKRAGGANNGGLRVYLASDNSVICSSAHGKDTHTMFEDYCDVDGYSEQDVYLYVWDCDDSNNWGQTEIDEIRFTNDAMVSTFTGDSITMAPRTAEKYTYLGCYKDTGDRALPVNRTPNGDVEHCSKMCADFKYFGRQWTGQCWCGNEGYDKYGATGGCACNGGIVGDFIQCVWENNLFGGTDTPDPSALCENHAVVHGESDTKVPTSSPTSAPSTLFQGQNFSINEPNISFNDFFLNFTYVVGHSTEETSFTLYRENCTSANDVSDIINIAHEGKEEVNVSITKTAIGEVSSLVTPSGGIEGYS